MKRTPRDQRVFKYGTFLEKRCVEIVRMVSMRIIDSAFIGALAGSSVHDFIAKTLLNENVDFYKVRCKEMYGFNSLNFYDHMTELLEADKILLISDVHLLAERSNQPSRTAIATLLKKHSGIIITSGLDYDAELMREMIDECDLSMIFHRADS